MSKRRNVYMMCREIGPFESGSELADEVKKLYAKAENVYCYCENVKECVLERINPSHIMLGNNAEYDFFEGRFFNEEIDVRWVKNNDGKWLAWKTVEENGDDAISVTAENRRYYLLGEYDESETKKVNKSGVGVFTEGRYPGKRFEYPVPENGELNQHDRAYIHVTEYQRKRPDWNTDNNKDDIIKKLNEPMLCGYRFTGVEIGRENEKAIYR